MRVETASSLESLFKKLDAGRTDLVIESRSSYCMLKSWKLNRITILEPSLEKILGYHWLSKRHADLLPKLAEVLATMKQDGTLKRIQDVATEDFNQHCVDGILAR
jgi:hypothetical protein